MTKFLIVREFHGTRQEKTANQEKWREKESEWDYFWHQFKYFKRLNGSCELELNHNTREKARMAVARAKDMK